MKKWFVCSSIAASLALSLAVETTPAATATGKGTITTYSYGTSSSAKFINISGQLFISAVVGPLPSSSNTAGGDWEGLNNTVFDSLSFDVKGPRNNFFVIFEGSGASTNAQDETVAFFGSNNFSSAVDLGNGITRYTITRNARSFGNNAPAPTTLNRIVFHQYAGPAPRQSLVIGNIVLNGNIMPIGDTTPTDCPAVTGDGPW